MDPKPKSEEQRPATDEKKVAIFLRSKAALGHHLFGLVLPRGKVVRIEIPRSEYDEASGRPRHDTPWASALEAVPGLLELIDEGGEADLKDSEGRTLTRKAEAPKKLETICVCALDISRNHSSGHYRGGVYWSSDPQHPLFYELTAAQLRDIEGDAGAEHDRSGKKHKGDPNLRILSKSRSRLPDGALDGNLYMAEVEAKQRVTEEEEEIAARVNARKSAESKRALIKVNTGLES